MKTVIFTFIAILININIYSQDYSLQDYFRDNYDPTDTAEGSVSNQLKRLYMQWGPRFSKNKGAGSYAKKFTNFVTEYNNTQKYKSVSTVNPNWTCLGPVGSNGSNTNANEIGRMNRICFDPQYNGTSNKTIYAASEFGGLWRTEDDGYNWANVNTDYLPTTSIADVVVSYQNSNNIFVATGLGDYGLGHWSGNKSNINPIFTAGIYRSTDYGATWEAINDGFLSNFVDGGTCRRMIINPTDENIIYVATSLGVFKTSNALSTTPHWDKVFDCITAYNDDELRGLEFKPDDYNTIYASGKDIYMSNNSGSTWASITGAETGLVYANLSNDYQVTRINIAVTPANTNKLYAYIFGNYLSGTSRVNKLYICKYSSGTWTIPYSSNDGSNDRLGFAVSPTNENEILFGHSYCYRSNNGGSTFSTISPYASGGFHADVKDLKYQPGNTNKVFCANDGGISVKDMTNTGTGGWEMRNNGLQVAKIWTFDDSENSTYKLAIGEQDVGSRIHNTNSTWSKIGGGDGYGVNIENYYDNFLFSLNNYTFYRFNYDNISTSLYIGNRLNPTNKQPLLPPNYYERTLVSETFKAINHPFNFSTYYTFWGEIYKMKKYTAVSTDTWQNLWELSSDTYNVIDNLDNSLDPWQRQHMELAISESNPDVAYSIAFGFYDEPFTNPAYELNSHMYKTTTGFNEDDISTQKWQEVIYPGYPASLDDPYPVLTGVVVHPSNPDILWVSLTGTFSEYKVWKSIDGGTTWTNEDPNGTLSDLPVNGIVYQKNTNDVLYIATDAGIFYKDATMTDWVKYGDFPNVRVTELKINYCSKKIRAATFGRGIWEGDLLPETHNNDEKIISENLTWDGNAWAESNIRVKTGFVLTLTGGV